MSIWRANGISGTGAALGAGAVLVLLLGGYFIVSQRPAVEEPAAIVSETPAAESAAETEEPSGETAVVEESATDEPATEETAAQEVVTEESTAEVTATPETTSEEAATEEVVTTEEATADATVAEETATQDSSQDTAQAEPNTPPAPLAPSFDVVRIDPDGSAVIAGTAAPGETVRLSVDGAEVASAIADASGKFVALFDLESSTAPRSLQAAAIGADGSETPSDGAVLIAPTKREVEVAEVEPAESRDESVAEVERDETETAAVSTEAAAEEGSTEGADGVADAITEPAGDETTEIAAVEVPETPKPEEDTTAPAIVVADSSGVRVVQPTEQPAAPGPEVTSNVVIDTITYDTEGEVALTGRGQGEGFVRVYLNEKPIRTTEIGVDGNWSAELPEVDAGVYRLRVDEVDATGEVTSRVETPFKREEPEVVEGSVQAVTVQPGFTLWGIAEERFGDGIQYVRVYEANRDLIRDPDLIYPGQVFTIPE